MATPVRPPIVTTAPATTVAPVGDEGMRFIPDPTSLRSIVTEFPVDSDFDPKSFYRDDVTNGWYPLVRKYVDTIMDECENLSAQHERASQVNDRRFQIITFSLIIVPLIIGFVTYIPFPQTLKNIFQGLLSLIAVALGAFNKFMKFAENAYLHKISRDKFMKLNGKICGQTLLPLDKRHNGVIFQRWAEDTFFTIKEMSLYPERKRSSKKPKPLDPTAPIPLAPTEDGSIPETPIDTEPSDGTGSGGMDDGQLDPVQYRKFLQASRTRERVMFRAEPRGT